MDPLLVDIARRLDQEASPAVLNDWLDRLEFVYESLNQEEQELCTQLTERVMQKLGT